MLVARARRAGLQRIAITDHDTIRGAVIARDLAPDLVIVGEEIRTASGGEILALYVQEEVPTGLPVQEVIRRLRAQGAVISVSHPLDRFRKRSALGWAGTQEIIGLVDALEGFNARCLSAADNQRAAELAAQHGLALTGGSDAHTPGEVGSGYVMLPPFADTPADFVTSLRGPARRAS